MGDAAATTDPSAPLNFLATYAVIGIGSALGGLARYYSGLGFAAAFGTVLPWATIVINILGSLVIGVFGRLTGAAMLLRQFVMVGICGGYTTFSAFSLETVQLAVRQQPLGAVANIALSVTLCLAAVWLGDTLGARLAGHR